MTAQPGAHEVSRFRSLIAQRLGLHFDESKLGNLAKVLAAQCQGDCSAYLAQLAVAPLAQLAALAPDLTVTETYFFRYLDQINAFAEIALPACLQAAPDLGPVRILSAGCASGDEPYSLAIAACEGAAIAAGRIALSAIDINPVMLAKAARGHYTAWSLREFPPALKQRWFRSEADSFVLSDAIRRMVRFENRNLADHDPAFWRPGSYDIIFCRNVLMYFTPEQMQAAVERIACALAPGGYLFVGHAESLRGLSNDFHLCHTHGTFYYRRKAYPAAPPLPQPPAAATRWHRTAALDDTTWVEAIARAAQRINVLADAAPGVALLQAPRAAACDAADPDALLLTAVSLSQSGALDRAEAACRQLLALDELNAGAHYVLGLCREEQGDVAGALGCYQNASYLDAGFAMARLHAGLLARRQGQRDAAHHDLMQALALLRREDAARLLMFGGGFKREALMALCRAELVALGGVA